jgi:cytidylate kinase
MKIISVSGQIGSGKSSVASVLGQRLGREVVSTGSIQRTLAQERGMTTLEFNLYSETNLGLDDLIDNNIIALNSKHQDVIVDSRMAWFFLPESLKVYLLVDPVLAARRVLLDERRSATETYSDQEVAYKEIRRRQESERKRFTLKYQVDYTQLTHYDLVIDTSYATPEEVSDLILARSSQPILEPETWLCPKRLYPTQHVRSLAGESAQSIDSSMRSQGFHTSEPIWVIRLGERFFIYDGHKRTSAAIRASLSLIPVKILFNADSNIFGLRAEDYVRGECSLSIIYDWEDYHNFRFPAYPSECDSHIDVNQNLEE